MKKFLILLLALPLALSACKKDDANGPTPSNSPAAPTMTPATTPSASPSGSPDASPPAASMPPGADPNATPSSPVGTWKVDFDKTSVKPPDEKSKAEAEKERIELKADGTYAATGGSTPDTGKWTLKGNVLTVTSDKGHSGPPPMILSADGNTLTAMIPAGDGKTETVVFVKG